MIREQIEAKLNEATENWRAARAVALAPLGVSKRARSEAFEQMDFWSNKMAWFDGWIRCPSEHRA